MAISQCLPALRRLCPGTSIGRISQLDWNGADIVLLHGHIGTTTTLKDNVLSGDNVFSGNCNMAYSLLYNVMNYGVHEL